MEISAINLNKTNFKGNEADLEFENSYLKTPEYDFDKVDFGSEDKKATSPTKFFVTTAALAIAAFAATKRTSFGIIKKLEGKFPLFNSMDNLGAKLNKALNKLKNKFPKTEGKNAKNFCQNIVHNMVDWLKKLGKKGVSAEEIAQYSNFKVGNLYGKNLIRKTVANTLGAGSATLVIASRHKDGDGNGIPDKAEKALSTAKEIVEAIPTVAAAVNLA